MTGTNKGIVLSLICILVVICALPNRVPAQSAAEPLLLVYPNAPTEFHYNPAEYETLLPSDPNYNSEYDVGGRTLWDKVEHRVAYEVYRAPQLTGFRASAHGTNEFVTMINDFFMTVDGFHEYPRQFRDLYVRFVPDPPHAGVLIVLNGDVLDRLITPITGFDSQTPTPEGFFTGTRICSIHWSGSVGIRITVYVDKNGNRVYDGPPPKWSIYVYDNTVPVTNRTWGGIKSMYDTK